MAMGNVFTSYRNDPFFLFFIFVVVVKVHETFWFEMTVACCVPFDLCLLPGVIVFVTKCCYDVSVLVEARSWAVVCVTAFVDDNRLANSKRVWFGIELSSTVNIIDLLECFTAHMY